MTLSFTEFVTEGLTPAALPKATIIISKYVRTQMGYPFFALGEAEAFRNETGKGWGIRFFGSKNGLSFRLNWAKPNDIGLTSVESADFWFDEALPWRLQFDTEVSLVKVLPLVVEILKTKGVGLKTGKRFSTAPDGVDLNESFLIKESEGGQMLADILGMMKEPDFKKGTVWSSYKSKGMKVFDTLASMYPKLLVKKGASYAFVGSSKDLTDILKNQEAILANAGIVGATMSRGTKQDSFATNPEVLDMENDMERLSFEQQIDDLERLTKMTINGSSNALFVAGRGGVGKTHTVEKILGEMGMTDGRGYFKNTGTASAAGIYTLFFRHQDSVILFDDSDGALADQDARNIIKAATDTKKVRKLVWNKMGKNVIEPDSDEFEDNEAMLDAGFIPRYFEFTGRVIFISNLPMNKLDPDGAIRTRAYIVDINPTDAEVYDFMEKIVDKIPLPDGLTLETADRKRVIQLMRNSKSKQTANLRKLVRGLSMMAASKAGGVGVSDSEMERLIRTYA